MERIEKVSISDLAQQFGTPLYVYSRARILSNLTRLQKAFEARIKSFRLHYAVKANSNLSILTLLRENGAGADCASPGELAFALKAGFSPGEILYTGNYESEEDLKAALESRAIVNLDDASSFERLKKFGLPEVLSFRINPGIGKGAFAQIVTGGEESKFGIPFERATEAYALAKSAGVKRFGIHMHVGSNILDPADFEQIVSELLKIAGGVFRQVKVQPEFIDIGGGFGIPYTDEEVALDLEKTAEGIVRAFQAGVREQGLGSPVLTLEPGRYLVADAGWLVARVTSVKQSYRKFVGLDAGMQALMRPALYGAFHRLTVVGKPNKTERVSICGQTCESTDVFYKDIEFPKAEPGDLAVFHDAGAYGYSMASSYNGRPRPAEVLVDGDRVQLIRRRETLADLLSLNSELEKFR